MTDLTEKLKVQQWPIGRLIAYPSNPRKNDAAVDRMVEAIREFGFRIPVVAKSTGEVVDGHLRLKAALALGMTKIPVALADGLSDAQIKAFRLLANRSATWAEWDMELLHTELDALKMEDFDLALTGFDETELADIFADRTAGLTDPDDTPEPPANPVSRAGDLWIMGEHRLMCGDATKAEDVARALGATKPHLMVTDPPYGVNYSAGWRNEAMPAKNDPTRWKDGSGSPTGAVTNDNRADWREAWVLFGGDVAYVWHGALHTPVVLDGLAESGLAGRALLIWVKQQFVIGRGDYHSQHEPCQPAGTLVSKVIKEGRFRNDAVIEQVPIETLSVGDNVVSFGNAKVYRNGRRITRIGSRVYTGNLHSINVGPLTTRATAEHQFTVRFNPTTPKAGLLYLMKRGDRYRIGVCGIFNSRGFGLAVRLSQELGEEAWIIGAFPDLGNARIAEQVASCIYGIPTTHWETDRSTGGFFQRDKAGIEDIYRKIGAARIKAGVDRLVQDYGLSLDHPIIIAGQEGRFSRSQSRIVHACNIIPGIMQIPVPTKAEGFDWIQVKDAEFVYVDGLEVWSMDVDQDRHYVADGIVTHNCWYAVRKGSRGHWQGDRTQSTVWQIDKPVKSETGHSTQKPVECMRRPIENNSRAGDAVYDPFVGSFTTGIACEMTGRRLIALEISPAYVDVGIRRWQNFCGGAATLEETGETFAQVEIRRASERAPAEAATAA